METVMFTNPYYVFPENVWEIILGKLEDSKDIQNVLRAFPILEEDLQFAKTKRYWLFDQVLPFIAPSIKAGRPIQSSEVKQLDSEMQELLLNCRLVCKRWEAAVNKLMENEFELEEQPHNIPNVPSSDWNDCQSYYSDQILRIVFPTRPYFFIKPESFLKFEKKMKNHYQNRNPFLSRTILISSQPGPMWDCYTIASPRFGENDEIIDQKEFWRNTDDFFNKFGKHLHILRLFVGEKDKVYHSFWEAFFKCMENLQNLKRLVIIGGNVENAFWNFLNLNGTCLRSQHFYLTQLRIHYNAIPGPLADHIISYFSEQLKVLDLSSDLCYYINIKSFHFPILTKLTVENKNVGGIKITTWLKTITAPSLTRLSITLLDSNVSISLKDVFCWLRRFPQLKYLRIELGWRCIENNCKVTEDMMGDISSISSLEYLGITDYSGLSYDFLRWLPNLRHLRIVTSQPTKTHAGLNGSEEFLSDYFKTRQLYESNVWNELPSLRTITLIVFNRFYCNYNERLCFDRTTFNELRRNGSLTNHRDLIRSVNFKDLRLSGVDTKFKKFPKSVKYEFEYFGAGASNTRKCKMNRKGQNKILK